MNFFDLAQVTQQISKKRSEPYKGSEYLREQIEVKGPKGQERE